MNIQELRILINKSGRSQKWIAAELNIPYITLSSYMLGYRTMPERVEQKIKEII